MRPDSEWCPSPNFHTITPDRRISMIVLHATATSQIESPREWLCDKASGVSAHYLIGRTGAILHLVHEIDVAWHAGESKWRGMEHVNPETGHCTVNPCSIGIEIVNSNDEKMEYPGDQLEACAKLVAAICLERGILAENVVGHLDVAPGRKTDPAGFPWDDFRSRLAAAGVP